MDDKMKRDTILEHYQNPINRGMPSGENYIKHNSRNASCVDNLDFYLKIEDETIIDIMFTGEACAISTAATSMMIKKIIGISVEEALVLIEEFEKMLNEEKYDENILTDLIVYDTDRKSVV